MAQGSHPTSTSSPSPPGGSASKPPQARRRWRRIGRRAGIALVGLVVLSLVVFFLLPVWISNEQGRAYILQRLNRRLNGARPGGGGGDVQILIDEWSLGWFHGTELKNFRIIRGDGMTLLSCPKVESGLTLWDIVWGNYDFRTTTADGLQASVTRQGDGSTTWDQLAAAAAEIGKTARGALQVNGGDVIVSSARSGESVRYSDVKATLTIASPDSPFHVQITAIGPGASGGGGGGVEGRMRDLSINATLPPIQQLALAAQAPAASSVARTLWSLVGDVEFSANELPAELFFDCIGLQSGWSESFGQTIETVRFSNHGSLAQDLSRPSLQVRGRGAGGGRGGVNAPYQTRLDLRMLLQQPDDRGAGGLLSMSASGGMRNEGGPLQAEAALRLSPRLAALLARIHPLLGEAEPASTGGDGVVRISASALEVPLDGNLEAMQGSGRLSFPPLTFSEPGAGRGIVGQLNAVTGQGARTLDGAAGVLRVRLDDGAFTYDSFPVTFGRARLIFSGSVGLDSRLDLLAVIPSASPNDLTSNTQQVVITGTTDSPIVQLAK